MSASVVTMSVQSGSGGYAVARHLSDRLRYRYYDWEITSEAAALAGVSPNEVIAAERLPGFLERMMRRLGAVSTVSVEGGVYTEPTTWNAVVQSLTSDDYRQFIERVVTELADRGDAVIVGHAGQYTLRGKAGVLKVLIHGSLDRRAQRLAEEQGMDLERAAATVKQADKDRSELIKHVYHFDWLDAAMYDLAINTDYLPLDHVTEALFGAARNFP